MKGPSAELEWTLVDEEESWTEPGAPQPDLQRPRLRAILVIALILFILSIATTSILRQRILHNQRQLQAGVQALVDLEAQAIASDDRELFLSVQSKDNADWLEWRGSIFDYYAANPTAWPRLKVTRVDLLDDYAWVHTTGVPRDAQERFQWVLFYFIREGVWRQAAPDTRYWGVERERDIGPLHFVYHERDEPYIKPIAADLTKLLTSLGNDLGYPPSLSLTVQLTLPHLYAHQAPTKPDVIWLPSPSAWPQPIDAPPKIPSISAQQSKLAYYVAFEAAGGKRRWENNPYGVWLVHAAANWAQERLERETTRPSWQFHTGQGQEVLRMAARTGQVSSLRDLWLNYNFTRSSYPAMIRDISSHYSDFDTARARAVIDYVVETHGEEAIPALLEAIGHNDTLEATLQEALNVGLDEFEPLWLTWLETHYGLGKGWRLAQAIAYWEETQAGPLALLTRTSTVYRQGQAMVRMAVQGNRVLPLAELWQGAEPGSVTSLRTAIAYSLVVIAPPDKQATLAGELLTSGASKPIPRATTLVGYPNHWRSAHALSVIEYIANAYGKEAVDRLPPAIVRHDTLDGALRDALGVGLDEFEPAWQAWLIARYEKDTN